MPPSHHRIPHHVRTLSRWLSAPTHRTASPQWRPQFTPLEDRSTPASFAGNTITLDDAGEVLTISTSVSGTYTLTSTVDVNGAAGPVAFTPGAGQVTVVDSATGTSVRFTNSTAAYAHPFTVTLNDAPGEVRLSGNLAFGANDLSVTTTRNIVVLDNLPPHSALVTTTSGNITFSASMQATPTTGAFAGVEFQDNVLSGTGAVSVSGRSGGDLPGVWVRSAGTIGSTGSGSVNVTGISPAGVGFRVEASSPAVTSGGGGT